MLRATIRIARIARSVFNLQGFVHVFVKTDSFYYSGSNLPRLSGHGLGFVPRPFVISMPSLKRIRQSDREL